MRTPAYFIVVAAWVGAAGVWRPGGALAAAEIKIVHIDVGQGDATLILGPSGGGGARVSVLVDAGNIPRGGNPDGGKIVGAALRENAVTRLDYFIATHYDADHLGGAITGDGQMHGTSFILGQDNVPGAPGDDDGDQAADWLDEHPAVMVTPDPEELGAGDDVAVRHFVDRGDDGAPSTQTFRKYRALAAAKPESRISLTTQEQVDNFEIDLGSGASLMCLAANGLVRGGAQRVANVNTENEKSLCFLLRHGGFDYLIGGDTIGRSFGGENAEVEAAIGEFVHGQNLNVDVLHVNHHGANNASESGFLANIAPEVAVISLGNGNPHHHPNDEALDRLVEAGVYRIYQTEWGTTRGETSENVRRRQAIFQGDIVITSDGFGFDIATSRHFPVDD